MITKEQKLTLIVFGFALILGILILFLRKSGIKILPEAYKTGEKSIFYNLRKGKK